VNIPEIDFASAARVLKLQS